METLMKMLDIEFQPVAFSIISFYAILNRGLVTSTTQMEAKPFVVQKRVEAAAGFGHPL
jgi:hypothetical protein